MLQLGGGLGGLMVLLQSRVEDVDYIMSQ
jgi:hypothetical protein